MMKRDKGITATSELSVSEKIGYGVASTGDAVLYSASGTFFMFFLTTVAGIPPAAAGVITAIGAVWNAIYNPIMGYFADRFSSRFGRRRPLMIAAAIPLAIVFLLLFTNLAIPVAIKPIWYGLMFMLFWTCYTTFFVPYLALGVDYTADYNQRISLRLYASAFNQLGGLIALSLPTALVALLQRQGVSVNMSWSIAGGTIGAIAMVTILITAFASKKKDIPNVAHGESNMAIGMADANSMDANRGGACDVDEKKTGIRNGARGGFSIKSLFFEYASVLKLSPARYLIVASTASLIAFTILLSNCMYYFTYNLGFASEKIATILPLRPIITCCFIPLTSFLARKLDKKWAFALFNIVGMVLLLTLKACGVTGSFTLALYLLATVCICGIYWQIIPSVYYDICVYDQYETGKNRQATIVSLQGLVEAAASGLGALTLGVLLGRGGFDGSLETQTEHAMTWIENCATWVPTIFVAIAVICMVLYPLTRRKYEQIIQTLESDT